MITSDMDRYNQKEEYHSLEKGDNDQRTDGNTDVETTPSKNEWQLRQSLLKLSGTTGNLKKKKTKAKKPEIGATQTDMIPTQPEVITVTEKPEVITLMDSDSDSDDYTPTLAQAAAAATTVTAGPSGGPATTASRPAAPANKAKTTAKVTSKGANQDTPTKNKTVISKATAVHHHQRLQQYHHQHE